MLSKSNIPFLILVLGLTLPSSVPLGALSEKTKKTIGYSIVDAGIAFAFEQKNRRRFINGAGIIAANVILSSLNQQKDSTKTARYALRFIGANLGELLSLCRALKNGHIKQHITSLSKRDIAVFGFKNLLLALIARELNVPTSPLPQARQTLLDNREFRDHLIAQILGKDTPSQGQMPFNIGALVKTENLIKNPALIHQTIAWHPDLAPKDREDIEHFLDFLKQYRYIRIQQPQAAGSGRPLELHGLSDPNAKIVITKLYNSRKTERRYNQRRPLKSIARVVSLKSQSERNRLANEIMSLANKHGSSIPISQTRSPISVRGRVNIHTMIEKPELAYEMLACCPDTDPQRKESIDQFLQFAAYYTYIMITDEPKLYCWNDNPNPIPERLTPYPPPTN
jgi:DNA-directed RNA polymerase subunit F